MKTKLYIIALLSVATISVNAQFTNPNAVDHSAIQSHQIMSGGAYSGTVYEPFSTATPSEQSTVGAQYSPSRGAGPRKGFDTGAETGQSEEFPIGDAVLPMLLCAAVFCGIIAFRRRRSALKS